MRDSRRGRTAAPERRSRRLGRTALAVAALMTLAACSQAASGSTASPDAKGGNTNAAQSAKPPAIAVSPLAAGKSVVPGEPVRLVAKGGTLKSVSVATDDGHPVEGSVSSDRTTWVSSAPTEYGTSYVVDAQVAGSGKSAQEYKNTFTTLSKADTYVGTYNVNKGATVGVGLPVSIVFNKPIADKAAVERGLKVAASPAAEGSWSWMKDRDGKDRVDYRPKEYWKPGTAVTLKMSLVGVDAGGGLYGTQNRVIDFRVGKSVVSSIDVVKKTLTVTENGKALRTVKVSTGKKKFETWNGTMVVLSKVPTIRMNSATVGIFGPEAYDLGDVKWDVQLTPSGTYAHAAPWNEGKFGKVNASHGCIGLSTADAKWFYDQVDYGDPVTVVNSTDTVAVNNGYGAWNVDWASWKKGSALQ